MGFDPIPQRLPCRSLVGIVVVTAEQVDLQVGGLAEAWDLVSPVRHGGTGRVGRGLALVRFMLGRDEADTEGLDGSNGAGRGLPVEVL